LEIFVKEVQTRVDKLKGASYLKNPADKILEALSSLKSILKEKHEDVIPYSRYFAYSLSRIFISLLLAEEAKAYNGQLKDISTLNRFIHNNPLNYNPLKDQNYKILAMDIDPNTGKSRGVGNINIIDGSSRNPYV